MKQTKHKTNPIPTGLTWMLNDNESADVTLLWRYDTENVLPDYFAIFWNASGKINLSYSDSSILIASTSRVYHFHGLPTNRVYSFGIASVTGSEVGPIQQTQFNPDWTQISGSHPIISGDLKNTQIEIAKLQKNVGQIASGFGALGKRLGSGLEHLVRGLLKEFTGKEITDVKPLILIDKEGILYDIRNAPVEFDLYAYGNSSGDAAYLGEVKTHLKPDEVIQFHKKVQFAEDQLGKPIVPFIMALSMKRAAKPLLKRYGIKLHRGARN